jgi:hypothetical protein
MSRRRKAARPDTQNARATALSRISGVAVTVPPGSFGMCVNGETSSAQWDTWSAWPKMLSATASPTTVQAAATHASGNAPKARTAMPTITAAAGNWAMPAASIRAVSLPAPPTARP